jgi:hypothetical protein
VAIPLAPLAAAVGKQLAAGIGKAMNKLAEWGKLFMVYRAGKGAQQKQDMEHSLDMARDARAIEEDVAGLSESELDDELRRRPDNG